MNEAEREEKETCGGIEDAFVFLKQEEAYKMLRSLGGSEMFIGGRSLGKKNGSRAKPAVRSEGGESCYTASGMTNC